LSIPLPPDNDPSELPDIQKLRPKKGKKKKKKRTL